METKNNLGIWMDHSTAQLIDSSSNSNHSINSEFTFDTKEEALNKSESLMHNKRQQMHKAYFKEISDQILKYNHVLLFGPTNAKVELHNYLNKDSHFKNIKIDAQPADKMTDKEKNAFVKNHFQN
ncbi:hypothetical protein FLGE108171_05560 [Flavobacterium gelidilacus]|uniref:hypothetical protein n=1 Tax=Flavobacterium gelidilacus TaxID=206041 RepID=UPI0004175923|nr:hypothetical protein [Flavobacterium gelidilacus]